MWQNYYTPTCVDEALRLLAEHRSRARLIAGGTDLVLELERKLRPGVDTLIDVSRIGGLDRIKLEEDRLQLGPLVTHNHMVASELCRQWAAPLVQACWTVGASQIRNRGTVVGNLVTASPANDTITPLWALDAELTLASAERGERRLPLSEFYRGVRQTALEDDEMVVGIQVPVLKDDQRGVFIKLGLRQAQAIAVVNVAVVLTFDGPQVWDACITLGSVAPTIIRASEAEASLIGTELGDAIVRQAARLAAQAARPIDDIRGSAEYRRLMVEVFVRRALSTLSSREAGLAMGMPPDPPMLWGRTNGHFPSLAGKTILHREGRGEPIQTVVNGEPFTVFGANDKTLLGMLREDIGLTGTKEGCAEGECGACTVRLDGIAVMACLVPAPRAHGARVVTVEGLAEGDQLHPLQQTFIDQGAVQCGYCTPGLLMSGASLLLEKLRPTPDQIKQSLTGNLCRCTGYYSVLRAIDQAAGQMSLTANS